MCGCCKTAPDGMGLDPDTGGSEMAKTIPASADVQAGDETLEVQYDALRHDALYLGAEAGNPGETKDQNMLLTDVLARYSKFVVLEKSGADAIKVVFSAGRIPVIRIAGYLLAATADVISAAPSGGAGTRYVMAQRTLGSKSFTLAITLTAVEGTDQRLVGQFEWTGTAVKASTIVSEETKDYGEVMELRPQAWAVVTSGGSLTDSYGVASVVKLGTGQYRLTWSGVFIDANYCVVACPNNTAARFAQVGAILAASVDIYTFTTTFAAADVAFQVQVFGRR